jgi:putative heme transporter
MGEVSPAPSEHQGITPDAILKRSLPVLVAGMALYGVAPALGEVLGVFPRLHDIEPGWFAAMAVTESASLICMCAVQRIATGEHRWGALLRSYLVGTAVSELVPGGGATSAAVQYEMLSHEGVPASRAASGMTAASLIAFGTLLLFNVLALPLAVLGVAVPAKLLAAAWISAALLLGIVVIGSMALTDDRFLTAVGRAAQWTINKLRRQSRPIHHLPDELLAQRDVVAAAVGNNAWQAMLAAAGKWMFDYLTLVFALAAVGAHPNAALVLVAYSAASLLRQLPITPGGLGVVEAGLTGALALIGVNGGEAVLATLAYRLFNYWLYLPAGLVGLALHRRATRSSEPVPNG